MTATAVKHLVVIFQENVSFDNYFGTYPCAANTSGQPFTALPGTPFPAGLPSSEICPPSGPLLSANPKRYESDPLRPRQSAGCVDLLPEPQLHGGRRDRHEQQRTSVRPERQRRLLRRQHADGVL